MHLNHPTRRIPAALSCALPLLLVAAACDSGSTSSASTMNAPGQSNASSIPPRPTHSSTVALTSDDRRAVVVNQETNTLAIMEVRDAQGADTSNLIAEIAVGPEPRSVALTPDDKLALVTHAQNGSLSFVALDGPSANTIVKTIRVGTEPRGVAITPNGTRAFVANHTEGTVSVIDVASRAVVDTIHVGGNPSAIAVSDDGDDDDLDETVYVTQFFAELIPGGPGEGFDNGKRGVVWSFAASGLTPPSKVTLSPLANVGFGADRTAFCPNFNANLHNPVYCPDVTITDPTSQTIVNDPQGAYPNQLQSLVLRNGKLLLPSIGAGPEPPVQFRVNVQALVHVVDAAANAELPDLTVNLNAQIKLETQPANPTQSLDRIFGNDIVAIDANAAGDQVLIVSRGGNYVIRASVDATGKLSINAPANVVRFQTGNLPNGIVMSRDGKRAYAYNEANVSITSIDLEGNKVIDRDVSTGTPPPPGTFEHRALIGKVAFHTALGIPDFGVFGTPIRGIEPLANRNKASDNGWSSCSSCHPEGLSDGVTWIFATGPRQTLPLDAFFSKSNPGDQRISNWSAVMGSITDFNNNAKGVQGGKGFAGDPPPVTIFNHGVTQGASDSLDAMTLWVQTVRTQLQPRSQDPQAVANGRIVFTASCAQCHGGEKWTKSQVVYDNDPTFTKDPTAGGVAFQPGLVNAGTQIVSLTVNTHTLAFLNRVRTFDASNPIELRGQGAAAGTLSLGGLGFNSPSLLGVAFTAPYLHDGSAVTLDDVFARHRLDTGAGGTIASALTAQQIEDLRAFLLTIDGTTAAESSETDLFLQSLGG